MAKLQDPEREAPGRRDNDHKDDKDWMDRSVLDFVD
jgi:hypothetical protein